MRPVYSKSAYDVTPLPDDRVAELAAGLDPEAHRVTQRAGTEPPFTGRLTDEQREGTYTCAVCGLPLFRSDAKFHSGSGWPSFSRPFDPAHVREHRDEGHGMVRTEVRCSRCGAHLGHVFDDGPRPTGLRYCINSAALGFRPAGEPLPPESLPMRTETAWFAGGCFWGVEHTFQLAPGVLDVVSGYMQGHTEAPTYEQVCSHTTGHAEAVQVTFDPARISYRELLEGFFAMHDPTQLDRQGPDVGDQYRSGVFTADEAQAREARAWLAELEDRQAFGSPIVTVIEPARTFWPAEAWHQDYIVRMGRPCAVRNPWPGVLGDRYATPAR
ncbi:MAG: bifunctional methionine sulfoxide reductase B/A protein [Deltaproteobacteria bacterium]|nr:bifunctional methionine sulfoxide reductase B/A protein [Deltaproteobacteria bacterium]